jgi:outer membrane protein insertion porin family
VRVGLIEPLGTDNGEPPNLQVPLATRFFAGGRVSHRAFATDRLGIVGETLDESRDPIGGNALLIVNLEYVQPIRSIFSAVAFVDVGNLWASPDAIDPTEVRWGVGLGLRAATPAGPLRLEYGYKLDREPGESSGELFLSFGIPF